MEFQSKTGMSSELRLKKLRGSGGYVIATVNDEQQMKGNLGGPDLFLAPIGRLDAEKITKHFCNTCEKEFEGSPKIEFENPNEEVAENLVLVEKGQYICNLCNASIAEYREFKKENESKDVGSAKPLDGDDSSVNVVAPQETVAQSNNGDDTNATSQAEETTAVTQSDKPQVTASVTLIEGKTVYDENANKIGTAKQVGIDSTQSMVLVIIGTDGSTESNVPWTNIKKIGDIVFLGKSEETSKQQQQQEPSSCKCNSCEFVNKENSKFCEECGNKMV